jgi:hypothetical protein
MQQFSSGSVLGLVLGYLTAKIGRIFLFSFGGFFLLGAVCCIDVLMLMEAVAIPGIYSFALAFYPESFTS